MSITYETYNETYNKPASLPHSFHNVGGKIYVQFLLLIITLHFLLANDLKRGKPKQREAKGRDIVSKLTNF